MNKAYADYVRKWVVKAANMRIYSFVMNVKHITAKAVAAIKRFWYVIYIGIYE